MAEVGKRLFWETVNIITAHDKIEDYLVIQMAETLQIALKINTLYTHSPRSRRCAARFPRFGRCSAFVLCQSASSPTLLIG